MPLHTKLCAAAAHSKSGTGNKQRKRRRQVAGALDDLADASCRRPVQILLADLLLNRKTFL